jgi:hypothetical protein
MNRLAASRTPSGIGIQISLTSIPACVTLGSLDWLLATVVVVSNASVSVINKLLLIMRTIRISFFGFGNFPSFMFNVCTLSRSIGNNTVKNLLQSKRNPQGRKPILKIRQKMYCN